MLSWILAYWTARTPCGKPTVRKKADRRRLIAAIQCDLTLELLCAAGVGPGDIKAAVEDRLQRLEAATTSLRPGSTSTTVYSYELRHRENSAVSAPLHEAALPRLLCMLY
jgi:hypothetical protein